MSWRQQYWTGFIHLKRKKKKKNTCGLNPTRKTQSADSQHFMLMNWLLWGRPKVFLPNNSHKRKYGLLQSTCIRTTSLCELHSYASVHHHLVRISSGGGQKFKCIVLQLEDNYYPREESSTGSNFHTPENMWPFGFSLQTPLYFARHIYFFSISYFFVTVH